MSPSTLAPNAPSTPLEGVIVVDLGQIYNAPYASLLLALAGADVIKVEPTDGELSRKRKGVNRGAGMAFPMLNSNKRGVTLNLKDERGQALLLELIDRADVIVENFRPGVMDRFNLGAQALLERKRSLVYASGSGYGQTGRYRDLPAMDLAVQAMSGVIASTGFPDGPPVKSGPALSDFLGGIHLYAAVVTALIRSRCTGQGAWVDVAMLDSVYPSLMSNIGPYVGASAGANELPERTGNRQGGLSECPYNVYRTSDGHISIICLDEGHWSALLRAMDRVDLVDDPRYSTKLDRIRAMDDVDALVEAWTCTRTTHDAFEALRPSGVVCAPVRRLAEVVTDPHFRERGMIVDADVDKLGPVPLLHTPLYFSGEARTQLRAAPELGEHNDEIFGEWLGHSDDELHALRRDGVI